MNKLCFFFVVCTAVCGHAAINTINDTNLVCDITIYVPAGTTTDIARVSGGAYTITKTGGGVVRFGWIKNSAAKLVVKEGHELYYSPDVSSLLAEAALHMDANVLNNDGYSETVGGTNFISRWYQATRPDGTVYAKHDDYAPAFRADPQNRRPFVRKAFLNGLDVVDFGPLQTTNNVDSSGKGIGYGASMVLSGYTGGLRDVFLIGGFTEDVATFRQDYPSSRNGMTSAGIIGSGGWDAYWPGLFSDVAAAGENPPLINFWQENYAYQSLYGQVYVNNDVFTGAVRIVPPRGVNYFNFRFVDPAQSDPDERTELFRFARWGNMSFGGARIGEVVAFTRRLSDDEHSLLENHLRIKWFGSRFARVTVENQETLEKKTDGTSYSPGFSTTPDVVVSAGNLVVDPLEDLGCWIRLDASRFDADDLPLVNGKRTIDTWPDADGGVHSANHSIREPSWRKGHANRKPFLASGIASNGLNVVDFGYPQNPGIVDADGNGVGYGAGMEFDTACTTIREALMVVADYDDDIVAAYPNAAQQSASMFLGATRIGNIFGRYLFEAGKMPIVLNPWQAHANPVTTNANGIAVDLVRQTPGAQVRLTAGLHLLNFRAHHDMSANGIAMDYANVNYGNFGGVRIGEMLVLERELDDDVRLRVSRTLMTKWMDKPPYVYGCGDVAVAAGAELSVPYAALSADKLVLGGKVTAEKVSASVIEPVSASAAVDGVLDMTTAGEVVLDDAVYPAAKAGDSIRIVAAGAVSGDVSGWTVSGALAEKFAVKLSAGDDGLYAELLNRGFSIIVR